MALSIKPAPGTKPKHELTEKRLAQIGNIIFNEAPITYEPIARRLGLTVNGIMNYVQDLSFAQECKVFNIHLGTHNRKYTLSELFKPELIAIHGKSVILDPKNEVHLIRLYNLFANGFNGPYTKEQRSSVTSRLKNMLPQEVWPTVYEKLRRT